MTITVRQQKHVSYNVMPASSHKICLTSFPPYSRKIKPVPNKPAEI